MDGDAPHQQRAVEAAGRVSLGAVVVASARRFVAIDGYDRALALAAKAFVAVVPLLLVVAAWSPRATRERAGARLIGELGLDRATAATVRQLVARPPDAGEPVTLVGLVVLVVSVLGFARSLQRTFETAWGLLRSGVRGYVPGLLGAAVFVGEVVALVLLAGLVGPVPGGPVVVAVVRAVAGALVWWPVQRLLVAGRVPWRDLLPGPVIVGVGQAAVMAPASSVLRPVLVSQAQRFGAIGVAFAIVTALTVLGVLLVVGAVLGPSVAGRAGSGPPLDAVQHHRQPDGDSRPGDGQRNPTCADPER
jgi:membrane protein